MIPPEAFSTSAACDGDPRCGRVPCFQVQLEAAQPAQADRRALACAYHVADVIETLRGWAGEHGLAGGQLTILAIEPAAGGGYADGSSSAKTAALREFAFSTIPLKTLPPGPAPHREPTS